jgi:spoIIIJ-associated protein
MEDLAQSAEKVAQFMRLLTTTGSLRLRFRITAGAGAADPDGFERRDIYVECKGPDAALLTERDGELLRALEHVAAKMLALESEEHDRVSFDVDGYKAARAKALRTTAEQAIAQVQESGEPFHFASMNSRERRMLHMFLLEGEHGMKTASSGEGARRHVVLYPQGYNIPEEQPRSFGDRGDRGGYGNRSSGNGGRPRGFGGGGRGGNRNGGGGRGRY